MSKVTCNWRLDDNATPGRWICVWCERPTSPKRQYDKPPVRNCPKAPDLIPIAERLAEETGDPTILSKIQHYGVALWRWSYSGFPKRSDEEVQKIYTEHCLPCEKRDRENDACRICGCNVRGQGAAAVNKIKMGTESCPLEKW